MLGRAECAAYLANSGYGQPKRTMLLVLSLQGRGPWDSVVIWSELRPLTGNSDICILLTDGESTPALAIAVSVDAYHGLSPYMALSRPCAKARSGGMSILPPMISIYAPVLLARAVSIAASSAPSVVTRAVYQSAHP